MISVGLQKEERSKKDGGLSKKGDESAVSKIASQRDGICRAGMIANKSSMTIGQTRPP